MASLCVADKWDSMSRTHLLLVTVVSCEVVGLGKVCVCVCVCEREREREKEREREHSGQLTQSRVGVEELPGSALSVDWLQDDRMAGRT